MTKNYIVYCFQCRMTIDEDDDQISAGRRAVDHAWKSSHMAVSVYMAEKKGIIA